MNADHLLVGGVFATLLILAGGVLAIWMRIRHQGINMAEVREELRAGRGEAAAQAAQLRGELASERKEGLEALTRALAQLGQSQQDRLNDVAKSLQDLSRVQREEAERVRKTVEDQLRDIRAATEQRLDAMRQVVEQQLQSTLERRLGESFRLVSERLEAVQKGLGEMKALADGVGDLKRVLSNVKTRGTWAEVRLAEILEEILTPDQFARNVAIRPESGERVEFAVRLPGRGGEADPPVWLPIDSKFPREDYDRLLEASQAGDAEGARAASEALARRVQESAREIREKYVAPPWSTDFAILFLPTEGLYAEILRQPGLHEQIQREHRVLLAGPTTLAALLNSLRMGFRTLAIEKRASEVWRVLAAVKTEFQKFGDTLGKVRKQMESVRRSLEETETRSRQMHRRLAAVETLPESEARAILQLPAESALDESSGDLPADG